MAALRSQVSGLPPSPSSTHPAQNFNSRNPRLFWAGEWGILFASIVEMIMSDLQRNMINYMVVCVNDYADRHGLSYAETFDYLLRNKGLDFLEDCYDAEHTLSLDTALDDLDAICKRNEGLVA